MDKNVKVFSLREYRMAVYESIWSFLFGERFLLWLALFELYRIKCGDIGKITAIQNEAGENFEKG